jgi:hypothetical protein
MLAILPRCLPRELFITSTLLILLVIFTPHANAATQICFGAAVPAGYVITSTGTDFNSCGNRFNNIWIIEKAKSQNSICYFSPIPPGYVITGTSTDFSTCLPSSTDVVLPLFNNIYLVAKAKIQEAICYFSPIPPGYTINGTGTDFISCQPLSGDLIPPVLNNTLFIRRIQENQVRTPIAFIGRALSGQHDVYTLDPITGLINQLTDDPEFDFNVSWDPTRSQVAFGSERNNQRDIWAVRSDGSGLRQLNNDLILDQSPAWSPDGTAIANCFRAPGVR